MLSVSRITSISEWLLRQPFIWGGLACLAFYAMLVQGAEQGSFLQRYFAGHPICYFATALFFVGLAALFIKLLGLIVEFATLESAQLPPAGVEGQTVEDVDSLLTCLSRLTGPVQNSYLVTRLRNTLQYVQRKASADTIEQQLHHLEEVDQARSHQSYSMVRIICSTIPILGFLGTVVGITLAIAKLNLSAEAMDESLPAVIAGLSVAFDTTALSLSLSTIILFTKFCVERVENNLLSAVDANVARQLIGRFQQYGTDKDPHLASVHRMSQQLLATVEMNTEKQSELLKQALEKTSAKWNESFSTAAGTMQELLTGTSKSLESSLTGVAATLDEVFSGAVVEGMTRHAQALNSGVERHAKDLEETLIRHASILNEGLQHHTAALTQAESKIAEENRRHLAEVEAAVGEAMLVATNRQEKLIASSERLLKEMQAALVDSAGATVAQQEQLVRQGEILLKVVEGTSHIKLLEDSLNKNLQTVSEAHNFEQTVAGLSATLQLLSARLGQPLIATESIDLQADRTQNKAA